jgi:acyl carrier protein
MNDVNVLTMFNEIAKKTESGKQLKSFDRDSKITSLGIDSVSMMEIIGEMEDELDIKIPDERLAQLQTIGDIESAVKALLPH